MTATTSPISFQRTRLGKSAINVAPTERVLSAIVGGGLIYLGLRHFSKLGLLAVGVGAALIQRGSTGTCAMYQALNINTARRKAAEPEEYFDHGTQATVVVTINKSQQELYRFCRDFTNFARFMENVKRVDVKDDRTSHWVVAGPAGYDVEWDAELINDEPDHLIAWRSLANADVANSGSIRFLTAPGDRGTEVHVVLDYIPPAGRLGVAAAKIFGKDAQSQLKESLRRLKQIIEAGAAPTVKGQPRGSCN